MERYNDLVKQVAEGDKTAFNELYQFLHRRVYFYALNIVRDEKIAEEVTADVFVEVWRCAANFQGRSKATTWVLGIARNISLKALRSHRHHEEDIDGHYNLHDGQGNKFETLFEDVDLVKKGLDRLSWKQREIITLVFFQELSYEEIAKILDIPVNTVKTRVFYAKKALKEVLSSIGEQV